MTKFFGLVRAIRCAFGASIAVFAISTGAAVAQNPLPGLVAPPPAAPSPAPAPSAQPTADMPWQKICETNAQTNEQICSVRADIRDDNGAVIVHVVLQRTAEADRYGLVVLVPLGVLIQPGVVVAIDGARALALPYDMCVPSPTVCIAQADGPATLIDQLKRGGQMTFTLTSPQRAIPLPLSLRGFTRVFDGPGTTVTSTQPGAVPAP